MDAISASRVPVGGLRLDWEAPLLRVISCVARFRYVLFAVLAAYLVGAGTGWSLEPHGIAGDWHYYADGGHALFGGSYGGGRGGVHLFADHPELTTGPLSLVAARGLLLFGAHGWFAAHVAIAALGLVSSRKIETRPSAAITPLSVACAAAPFVLGDSRTLAASGKYNLGIAADSGLRVLHLAAGSAPHWLRAAQLAACLAVAALAVLRRRPEAVLFLALATKVSLDSETVAYYSAAALFGALAYDLVGRRSALPVWTLATYLALHSSMDVVASPMLRAEIRIGVPLMAVLLVLGQRPRATSFHTSDMRRSPLQQTGRGE